MPEIRRSRKVEKHPGEDEAKEEAQQESLEIEEKQIKSAGEVKEEVYEEDVEKENKEEEKESESGIKGVELEWIPKTVLGKKVNSGEITDIDQILKSPDRIMEPQIVDKLLPNLEVVLLNIGQAKGKFGGGKRNIWRQTQKKTKEGNRIKFATFAVVGNKNGYVGIGFAKAKETVPAREKAIRNAKLNIIKIPRGCGSWDCGCGEEHSIPYKTSGKSSSVKVELYPAPKGTGILTESEVKKILDVLGITDVYSKTYGQTKTKINVVKACFDALNNLSRFKRK